MSVSACRNGPRGAWEGWREGEVGDTLVWRARSAIGYPAYTHTRTHTHTHTRAHTHTHLGMAGKVDDRVTDDLAWAVVCDLPSPLHPVYVKGVAAVLSGHVHGVSDFSQILRFQRKENVGKF